MNLSPYLDLLRRDLLAAAAPGGPDVTRAAELLSGALDASARLSLLEALSEAAAEITTRLSTASVEVRLRGRDADLVVTDLPVPEPAVPPAAATAPDSGDLARITLRLPDSLKEQVERIAGTEGISVNSWLVRAIGSAVTGGQPGAGAPGPGRSRTVGRRVTGYAQA